MATPTQPGLGAEQQASVQMAPSRQRLLSHRPRAPLSRLRTQWPQETPPPSPFRRSAPQARGAPLQLRPSRPLQLQQQPDQPRLWHALVRPRLVRLRHVRPLSALRHAERRHRPLPSPQPLLLQQPRLRHPLPSGPPPRQCDGGGARQVRRPPPLQQVPPQPAHRPPWCDGAVAWPLEQGWPVRPGCASRAPTAHARAPPGRPSAATYGCVPARPFGVAE